MVGRRLFLIAIFLLFAQFANADVSMRFPDGFVWGVSTAAHQIEGYNVNSDWWDWEQVPGHIQNGDKSGAACDSWNRVREDIGLLKQLGVQGYRFSVEWAKIEPVEGQYDAAAIQHYRDEVELLRINGINPLITLQHFTFPRWVRAKGGWEWNGIADAFAAYTELVYTQIAPGNRDWITVNEPMVNIMGGYYQGSMPPGETRGLAGIIPVVAGMLKAHAAAYHKLHELADKMGYTVRVGVAHHLRYFEPKNPWNPLDDLATLIADAGWNWMIPNAMTDGHLKLGIPFYLSVDEEIPGLAGTQDFLGVNYYSDNLIAFDSKTMIAMYNRPGVPETDMDWDIFPEGFSAVLEGAHNRYPNLSILVTENGIANADDQERPEFIVEHLTELWKEIQKGVPVEAYYHWSLMDNFEWINGFTPRFGLYAVDYKTFDRVPRESATLYHNIIQNNGF